MRDVWANAPVVTSLNGAAVRIAGFVIPLERVKDEAVSYTHLDVYKRQVDPALCFT